MNRRSTIARSLLSLTLFFTPLTAALAAPLGSPTVVNNVFGGLYIKKFLPPGVDYMNGSLPINNGDAQPNLLSAAGETTLFVKNKSYYVTAFSTAPTPKAIAKDWFDNHVLVRIDGDLIFDPSTTFPHFFSYATDQDKEIVDLDQDGVPDLIRGYPMYVPAELIEPGVHEIEILVDGSPVPIRAAGGLVITREYFSADSDFKLTSVSPGPGPGELTINIVHPDAVFNLNIHSGPGMGNPLDFSVAAVNADGSLAPAVRVGSGGSDWPFFNEHSYHIFNFDQGNSNHLHVRISGLNSGSFFFQLQGSGPRLAMPGVMKEIAIP